MAQPEAPRSVPRYIGWKILAAVALGITFDVLLVEGYKRLCAGVTVGVCDMIMRQPPWLVLTSVAAAPAVLLTWYWRTKHADAAVHKGLADITNAVEQSATDRYAKAVEMLAHDSPAVRMGAIFVLERLYGDSERDRWTILETIAAFVRVSREKEAFTNDEDGAIPEDVQAALTVLGRLTFEGTQQRHINLSGSDLTGANMVGAYLPFASFQKCILHACNFDGAALSDSDFHKSHISLSTFNDAELSDSDFNEARLSQVDFLGAKMAASTFRDAIAEGVLFASAKLVGARLPKLGNGCVLEEADLCGADLGRAGVPGDVDFTGAIYDGNTRLPPNFDPVERGMMTRAGDKVGAAPDVATRRAISPTPRQDPFPRLRRSRAVSRSRARWPTLKRPEPR